MAPSAVEEHTQLSVPVKAGTAADEHDTTPLEAISHGDVMPGRYPPPSPLPILALTRRSGIPSFPTFAQERRHILTHMAAVFRYWARTGCTEGQSGHISVRDPEFPGCMWMNTMGRHFGALTAGDMLLLDITTGRIVAGAANLTTQRRTANAAGYFIHSAIHQARGDVHAICHA